MLLLLAILLVVLGLPSPWAYVAIAVALVIEVAKLAVAIDIARRRQQAGVVGAPAKVTSPCRPEGAVSVRGELWPARCEAGAERGERVRVAAVDGRVLVVERTA